MHHEGVEMIGIEGRSIDDSGNIETEYTGLLNGAVPLRTVFHREHLWSSYFPGLKISLGQPESTTLRPAG